MLTFFFFFFFFFIIIIIYSNTNEEDDNKNFIVKLNEYLQDKNTNINLSDVIFEYGNIQFFK